MEPLGRTILDVYFYTTSRRSTLICFVTLLLLLIPLAVQAQSNTDSQVFKGLNKVWVSFIYTDKPVPGPALREKIISRLRAAGLIVVPDSEVSKNASVPVLTMNLRIREDEQRQIYAVNARLELSDYVLVLRNGTKDLALTWTSEELTSPVPVGQTSNIEGALMGLVDEFVKHKNAAAKK